MRPDVEVGFRVRSTDDPAADLQGATCRYPKPLARVVGTCAAHACWVCPRAGPSAPVRTVSTGAGSAGRGGAPAPEGSAPAAPAGRPLGLASTSGFAWPGQTAAAWLTTAAIKQYHAVLLHLLTSSLAQNFCTCLEPMMGRVRCNGNRTVGGAASALASFVRG